MQHIPEFEFDFGFDADEYTFDDHPNDVDAGTNDDIAFPFASNLPQTKTDFGGNERSALQSADEKPAAERITELFEEMAPQRRTLLGILRFTSSPRLADEVAAEVDRLQLYARSVYTSADFTRLLESAGALQKCDDNASPLDVRQNVQPETVQVEGIDYWKPAPRRRAYWIATADGASFVDADRPLERFRALIEKEPQYAPIYLRVLELCRPSGGATMKSLATKVDDDPLLKKTRVYASRFVDRLENCDAISWDGAWHVTDNGSKAIDFLESNGFAQSAVHGEEMQL